MKVRVIETDDGNVTKVEISDPRGLRAPDMRRPRFGWMFSVATMSVDPIMEFEVETQGGYERDDLP